MSEPFDPYRKWLGIPPKDQPPNHYRLLGIAHFEDDPDVIESAATRQLRHVRIFQSGKHSALSQRVLNELSAAKLCLLNASRKTVYEEQLRAKLKAEGKLSSDNLLSPPDLMSGPAEDDEPPREGQRRTADARWKTETEDVSPAEPPIVPIPMPVGTAVAAPPRLAPSLPLGTSPLVVASSRSSYRPKKSSSAAIPLFIAFIGLVVIVAGGIAALFFSGALAKLTERHPQRKPHAAPTSSTKDRERKESVARPQPK